MARKVYTLPEAAEAINHIKAGVRVLNAWTSPSRKLVERIEVVEAGRRRVCIPESEVMRLKELFAGKLHARAAADFVGLSFNQFKLRADQGSLPGIDLRTLPKTPAGDLLFPVTLLRVVSNRVKAEGTIFENTVSTTALAKQLNVAHVTLSLNLKKFGIPHYVVGKNLRVPSVVADLLTQKTPLAVVKGFSGTANWRRLAEEAVEEISKWKEKRLLDAAQNVLQGRSVFAGEPRVVYKEIDFGGVVSDSRVLINLVNKQPNSARRQMLLQALGRVVRAHGGTGEGLRWAQRLAEVIATHYNSDLVEAEKLLQLVGRPFVSANEIAFVLPFFKLDADAAKEVINSANPRGKVADLAAELDRRTRLARARKLVQH